MSAGIRTCPRCGLIHPPSASRCDCGYTFSGDGAVEARVHEEALSASRSELIGALAVTFVVVVAGLVIAGYTGRFFIGFIAFAIGGVGLGKAWSLYMRLRK